jgi:hypothetical protein
MEHVGSEYVVILNDSQLRKGLIRDAARSRRSRVVAHGSHELRRMLAQALHWLASRVDPASRTVDPRPAPASTVP